jgi:hypothetical protein
MAGFFRLPNARNPDLRRGFTPEPAEIAAVFVFED